MELPGASLSLSQRSSKNLKKAKTNLIQSYYQRDKQQIYIWFLPVFQFVSCIAENYWHDMSEQKPQHLLRLAMKANIFLLFLSPLSTYLFNNWNPALGDLDLTMSKPPVVEPVPSVLFAWVQVHLLHSLKNYCAEPAWDLRCPSWCWMYFICGSEISIFCVLLFGYIPIVSHNLYFCTRNSCLKNYWNKPQWASVWLEEIC